MYLARVLSEMMRQNQRIVCRDKGTMLARINKHIPKASELQMVTLFLITNIFSCPPLSCTELEMNLQAVAPSPQQVSAVFIQKQITACWFVFTRSSADEYWPVV